MKEGDTMKLKKSFSYALRHSLPIFAGFIPLGLAYDVLMHNAGYNFVWTGATCLIFVGRLTAIFDDLIFDQFRVPCFSGCHGAAGKQPPYFLRHFIY